MASIPFLLGEWFSIGKFPLYTSIITLIAIGCLQSAGSWLNFVFDRELDKLAGDDISFFDYISPQEMALSSFILSIIGLVIMVYIGLTMLLLGLLIFMFWVLYVTPPVRLKTRPPFDSIFNAFVFALLPFWMGWTITDQLLTPLAIIYGLTFGLIVVSYYILLSSLDIETDKKYGIETSCTKLGFKGSINMSIILYLLSLLLALYLFGMDSFVTISFLICLPLFLVTRIKYDKATLGILIASISFVLMESLLISMFVISLSITPFVLFILNLLVTLYFIFVYIKIIRDGLQL